VLRNIRLGTSARGSAGVGEPTSAAIFLLSQIKARCTANPGQTKSPQRKLALPLKISMEKPLSISNGCSVSSPRCSPRPCSAPDTRKNVSRTCNVSPARESSRTTAHGHSPRNDSAASIALRYEISREIREKVSCGYTHASMRPDSISQSPRALPVTGRNSHGRTPRESSSSLASLPTTAPAAGARFQEPTAARRLNRLQQAPFELSLKGNGYMRGDGILVDHR